MAASAIITCGMYNEYTDIFFMSWVPQRHAFIKGSRSCKTTPSHAPHGICTPRAIQERINVPITTANHCTTRNG